MTIVILCAEGEKYNILHKRFLIIIRISRVRQICKQDEYNRKNHLLLLPFTEKCFAGRFPVLRFLICFSLQEISFNKYRIELLSYHGAVQ